MSDRADASSRRIQVRSVTRLTVVAPAPLPRDPAALAAALLATLNERRGDVQRTLDELRADLARVDAAIATLRDASAHYDQVGRAERILEAHPAPDPHRLGA